VVWGIAAQILQRSVCAMQLSGDFILTLSFGRQARTICMGSADDWARQIGEQIKSKQQNADNAAERVATNRNIIAEQMPQIWDDLIAAFRECCKAVNEQVKPERKLALHQSGKYDFMVRPDAMEEIVRGHYAHDAKTVSIQTRAGTELFLPKVFQIGAGEVRLASRSTGVTSTVETIARTAIEKGLGI
jgi:hypothetical protein